MINAVIEQISKTYKNKRYFFFFPKFHILPAAYSADSRRSCFGSFEPFQRKGHTFNMYVLSSM